MCGDVHAADPSLAALISILADESRPLSMTMRRLALHRLRQLESASEMLKLITGRDDWKQMTLDECNSISQSLPALCQIQGHHQKHGRCARCGAQLNNLETAQHETLETGDYRDTLYSLLVRRGYAQHEAYEISYGQH